MQIDWFQIGLVIAVVGSSLLVAVGFPMHMEKKVRRTRDKERQEIDSALKIEETKSDDGKNVPEITIALPSKFDVVLLKIYFALTLNGERVESMAKTSPMIIKAENGLSFYRLRIEGIEYPNRLELIMMSAESHQIYKDEYESKRE